MTLREALAYFGRHDTGCPGWYRAVWSPSDPAPKVKCFDDPCDCGLDDALADLETERCELKDEFAVSKKPKPSLKENS